MNALAHAPGDAGLLPGWLVLAVAVLVAVGLFMLLLRAQSFRLPAVLLVLVGGLVIGYSVVLLHQKQVREEAARAEEQAIKARATALDAALASSGLACLDAPTEVVARCEEVVFARPETVAAARVLVRGRLLLLADADALSHRTASPALVALTAVWREGLARDPFGLVAVVLREDFTCADGQCPAARSLGASSRAPASLNDKTFENLYATHSARWSDAAPARLRPAADLPAPTVESPAGPPGLAVVPPAASPASAPPQAEPPAEAPAPPAPVVVAPVAVAPVEAAPVPAAEAPLPPVRPPVPSAARSPATPRPAARRPGAATEPDVPPPGSLQ